jgi:predicted MPP superfamily phosphohydrolase
LNRRIFVRSGAALFATGTGLAGYATIIEPHWLEMVKRDLRIARLPSSLAGASLVQLSDIHVCTYVDEKYLIRSLDKATALSPDIVVITGDFVTWEEGRSQRGKLTQLHRVLDHLPRGRLATLAILGNHDYGHTWRDPQVASVISAAVAEHGVMVLRNQVQTVSGLDFIGIDDLWSGRSDTRAAFATRTSDAAICLCHNPDALDELVWDGYSGWILSGHTHGGQCKPPFLPPPVLPVKNRRYTSGEIQVDAHRTVYISRGMGHLLRARFNVRPEITMFTLTA